MQVGLYASYDDTENGMTLADMAACLRVANQLNELIIFRSTGPWSKRWLESSPPYPSKNFHVKGKSSDWGPQAGFVPHNGEFSKVGHATTRDKNDRTPAMAGTVANDKGIADGFAGKAILRLTLFELNRQRDLRCESPARSAIDQIVPVGNGDELILRCTRPGDGATYNFLAIKKGGAYDIYVLPRAGSSILDSSASIADRLKDNKIDRGGLAPLYVMASEEAGASRRPMTGDYDLMAVCPHWGNYMSRSLKDIYKPAIELNAGVEPKHAPEAAMFLKGVPLDKVLDMRLHTGAKTKVDFGIHYDEHGDMGNITGRILRAVNALNAEMGATGASAALRRVHHNAESHRNAAFGALTNADMTNKADGFPLTAFHPLAAVQLGSSLVPYGTVVTLETMGEFRTYAADASRAGYFLPKNWTWGMSIRDTADAKFGFINR